MSVELTGMGKLERTAYGRPKPTAEAFLTQVSAGTPCGEMLRRYWQPVLGSTNVTGRPQKVRLLGEDLIVFRDGSGRPGLLYPHCMHRGTSLFYGKVEDDGIRCCYHGWKFDVEGHCLEQPCEPKGSTPGPQHRQPWYPARDHYGLVWAYMGPPDKMPLLPRFAHLEPLGEDEHYHALDNSVSAHADLNGPAIIPYSWLNINDNCMDPYHVYVLHSNFSVGHFVKQFSVLPSVTWEEIPIGVIYKALRRLPDGREMHRIATWIAPNMLSNPGLGEGPGGWVTIFTAVDDNHMRSFVIQKSGKDFKFLEGTGLSNMKPWSEMTPDERRDSPNDYEAQSTQGPEGLPNHSDEHLVRSDLGISLQRRVLRREIEKVMTGGDPLNVAFRSGDEILHVPSGNFFYGTGSGIAPAPARKSIDPVVLGHNNRP
jgi:nitrite reductase/ring-hydroxylating ferredoxin subunit